MTLAEDIRLAATTARMGFAFTTRDWPGLKIWLSLFSPLRAVARRSCRAFG